MTDDAQRRRDASGRFARQYDAKVRLAVQHDYEESDRTVECIARDHHIATSTVHDWAGCGGWMRRLPPRVDPDDLLGRMLGLLDRQMTELETSMTNGATEVAMLAKLVTTLDKVLVLKERSSSKPRSSKRVDELRAKIAERISELNRA